MHFGVLAARAAAADDQVGLRPIGNYIGHDYIVMAPPYRCVGHNYTGHNYIVMAPSYWCVGACGPQAADVPMARGQTA